MKKNFLLIMLVSIFCLTSCGDEDCDHSEINHQNSDDTGCSEKNLNDYLEGTWYNEFYNEETRFESSGTLYDKYCNIQMARETSGRYEANEKNMTLTFIYFFSGQSQYSDFKITEKTENSFTLKSNVGNVTYERVLQTYNMKVDDEILLEYSGKSFKSTNDRIASVDNTGKITAKGEKGTAYIKIVDENNQISRVKVVVGVEVPDLWYDFVSFIGMDFTQVKKTLEVVPEESNEGQAFFVFQYHNVYELLSINYDKKTNLVTGFGFAIKEGMPISEVLAYMSERYYKVEYIESDDQVFFTTSDTYNDSKALLCLNLKDKVVVCERTYPESDLWNDYTNFFGYSDNEINKAMGASNYIQSDYSYSKYGSDYYNISNNAYTSLVGFVFNKEVKMDEYWVYLLNNCNANDVYAFLVNKYKISMIECDENRMVFYNRKHTLKVIFDLSGYVSYTDLTSDLSRTIKTHNFKGNKKESFDMVLDKDLLKQSYINRLLKKELK